MKAKKAVFFFFFNISPQKIPHKDKECQLKLSLSRGRWLHRRPQTHTHTRTAVMRSLGFASLTTVFRFSSPCHQSWTACKVHPRHVYAHFSFKWAITLKGVDTDFPLQISYNFHSRFYELYRRRPSPASPLLTLPAPRAGPTRESRRPFNS